MMQAPPSDSSRSWLRSDTASRKRAFSHVSPPEFGVRTAGAGHTPRVVRNPRSVRNEYTSRPPSYVCASGSSKTVNANAFPSGHITGRASGMRAARHPGRLRPDDMRTRESDQRPFEVTRDGRPLVAFADERACGGLEGSSPFDIPQKLYDGSRECAWIVGQHQV